MSELYDSASLPLAVVEESTAARLERQKKHLLNRVADIDEALRLLRQYPDMEKLTDLLRRI